MKICKKCKETKSLNLFSPNHTTRDRKSIYCKSCESVRARANYKKLAEREHIEIPLHQVCSMCSIEKLACDFTKANGTTSGLFGRCRACQARLDKQYYETKHREDVRKMKLKIMLQSARKRAKQQGLSFDIDIGYLMKQFYDTDICPILQSPIDWMARGKVNRNSPSLDKIIQEKGYVKGNIQLISYKANTMKQDATPHELRRFAEFIMNSK